jgi:putative phosphoribosyl transferase
MIYEDRTEAGRRLGEALRERLGGGAGCVLGIPRGGVIVAREVARVLGLPLDVWVARKIGAPSNPECAVGAVAWDGTVAWEPGVVASLRLPEEWLAARAAEAGAEAARRAAGYREGRAALAVAGKEVVLVDDGLATGSTARAAVQSLRGAGARRVIFAAPVGPPGVGERLGADLAVVLEEPPGFYAVGAHYAEFEPVPDALVVAALAGRPV